LRVVLDTNVVVSGLIRPVGSPPGELLSLWFSGRYDLVTSPPLLAEYREVLKRPRIRRLIRDFEGLLHLLRLLEEAETVTQPARLSPRSVRDPKDVMILGTALAGRADLIVSGDQDLLVLRRFRGIPILDPGAALEVIRGR
jgi:putative PIN family toxin of toxin-antitoxin system